MICPCIPTNDEFCSWTEIGQWRATFFSYVTLSLQKNIFTIPHTVSLISFSKGPCLFLFLIFNETKKAMFIVYDKPNETSILEFQTRKMIFSSLNNFVSFSSATEIYLWLTRS